MTDHRGWHSRGFLPHFDRPNLIQAVTFRLADALPHEVLARLERSLEKQPEDKQSRERRIRLQVLLDAGSGECWLRRQDCAQCVEEALLHFDGDRYRLLAWVVMPNHVHGVLEIINGHGLDSVVHSWKSYSAKRVNSAVGRSGRLWQPEYWDRFIRDERHLREAITYTENNPVMAGFCENAVEWRFGSARWKQAGSLRSREPSSS